MTNFERLMAGTPAHWQNEPIVGICILPKIGSADNIIFLTLYGTGYDYYKLDIGEINDDSNCDLDFIGSVRPHIVNFPNSGNSKEEPSDAIKLLL